jgi:hypothetical protein
MNYKLTNYEVVIRIADNAFIPFDPANRDYREYLEWLDAGNTPEPADQPAPVNPLDAAEAHIAAHFSTPRLLQMKVWWDTFPPDEVPKLAAVFDWTTGITVQAAQGSTSFTAPPHTFEELVVEAMQFLTQ